MSKKSCIVVVYDEGDTIGRVASGDEKVSKKEAQRIATGMVQMQETHRAEVFESVMAVNP